MNVDLFHDVWGTHLAAETFSSKCVACDVSILLFYCVLKLHKFKSAHLEKNPIKYTYFWHQNNCVF